MQNPSSLLFGWALIAFASAACGGRTNEPQAGEVGDGTGGTSTQLSTGEHSTANTGGVSLSGIGGRMGVGGSMTTTSTGGASPLPVCGDGVVSDNEECDDLNAISGDGCSAVCKLEGWAPCDGCVRTVVCGNAVLEVSERCDDGNITDGDGCSVKCSIEPGFYCPVPGKACLPLGVPPTCGNGTVDPGETCDYGAGSCSRFIEGFCWLPGVFGECTCACIAGSGECSDGNSCNGFETCFGASPPFGVCIDRKSVV